MTKLQQGHFHTFQESLNGFVDTVLKMLQYQHNLIVAFVGNNSSDSTDLERKCKKGLSQVNVHVRTF